MSPGSRSKSKDKRTGKELPQKASSKPSGNANPGSGVPVSGYNPLLGKFHTLETAPLPSALPLHTNGRFRNIDETDDHSPGTGVEYDTISNNGSWSGESDDPKEKTSNPPHRQEATISGADSEKREKIRQKNEKKHQRQKEKRAQELHERCSGFLTSRKLEALAQQLVGMGFSSERATMALILNEGKIEESVVWLLEGGEEADKHQEQHNLDEGNLKIDISEELARIADMEIRYKCSKQEAERAIVACEGDLDKAVETLRVQKQDPLSPPSKPEETGDSLTISNGQLSISGSQNLLRAPQKPNPSSSLQQRRDEKDFNFTKPMVTVGVPMESSGKNAVQALRKIQPKVDGAKLQQVTVPADKRWPSAVSSNPSVSSYSLASPLQVSPPLAKTETRHATPGSELKNLKLGSVKEPVVVMQRPQSQSANVVKQAPITTTSISSSPPGTTSSWPVEVVKPNGLSVHMTSTRSVATSNSRSNELFNQLLYQHQQQQYGSRSGALDPQGASWGNGLWNRMGSSPTLSAASSLGLFSGLGSNGSSGSGSGSGSSPVDWNTSGSMLQLDYTNIDWTLDRTSSMSRSSGMFPVTNSGMQNTRIYDSYTYGSSAKTSMRPALANGVGAGVPLAGLQDGVTSAEMAAAVSREWSSPFEEKDLFSLPRQFVSSPSHVG